MIGVYFLTAAWQFARELRGDVKVFAPLNGAIRGWA
jgi:hypothetical protein